MRRITMQTLGCSLLVVAVLMACASCGTVPEQVAGEASRAPDAEPKAEKEPEQVPVETPDAHAEAEEAAVEDAKPDYPPPLESFDLVAEDQNILGMTISPDAKWLAFAESADVRGGEGHVKIWDLHEKRTVGNYPATIGVLHSLSFAPDGNWLVSGGGKTLDFWQVPDWQPPRKVAMAEPTAALAFSPDSRRVAVLADSGNIYMVELGQFQVTKVVENCPNAIDVCWDPRGNLLAVGGNDGVTLYEAEDWRLRRHLETKAGVLSLDFSPDGKTLAAGAADRNLYLWDVASGTLQTMNVGGSNRLVTKVAWHPEGTMVAVRTGQPAGRDGLGALMFALSSSPFSLWDPGNGGRKLTINLISEPTYPWFRSHMEFFDKGRRVAVLCSMHNHVKAWDVARILQDYPASPKEE